MKKFLQYGVMIMFALLLSGCMGSVDQYRADGPKLDLEQFLQGKITGQGVIENWKGKVVSRFDFEGVATWEGDTGTFKEKMTYYNGKVDHRTWTIKKVGPDHFIGTTDDLVGQADIRVSGNAMNWHYQMNVDVNGKKIKLSFNDWMFLMNNGGLININYFKKFGFTVGRLTLYMHRENTTHGKQQ